MLKITEYADRLIDLEDDFIDRVKTQQINWIGKKLWNGSNLTLRCVDDTLLN